jgi:hypothetical protein
MKTLSRLAVAALFSATPFCLAPAFAAGMQSDTMSDSHPMMMSHVACKATDMSATGLMIEFHNTGKSEIAAGTKAHWRLSGVAQGDVDFKDALAAGGMMSMHYAPPGDMMHMSGHPHCTVAMM